MPDPRLAQFVRVLLVFMLLPVLWGNIQTGFAATNPERILVVAPHPDDESLAIGGWLADRIASGAEVWAMMLTDGEAYPHPEDTNSDHRAAAYLINQALPTLPTAPELMMYLVHRRSRRFFPQPYGYLPQKGLKTPPRLPEPVRYAPTASGRGKKELAVRSHKTQIKLGDVFLLSFLRAEEFFWLATPTGLQNLINKHFHSTALSNTSPRK